MSKGGGGSSGPQQTESTVTQTNLPEYAEPYFTRLMQRGEAESLQPYRTYPGQRLAQQSPAAQRILGRQTALGLSSGPSELREASDIARQVAAQTPTTRGQQLTDYTPSNVNVDYGVERFDAGKFDTGIAQMYMNPFQRLVTDIEKREARRASDITGEQIGSQAAQAGGLGGYREAILQAERERNLGQQLGDIEARGQRQAFAEAQQQFERDRLARAQAAQFNEAQRRQLAQFGIGAQQADIDAQLRARQLGLAGVQADQAAQQQRLASAQLLAAQGPAQQQLAFDRLRAAQEAQEVARNFRQAGLDIGYQDFLNQVAFPRQQLGFQSQILQGLPVTPGTQVSQYQPRPSTTQQLLGLGLGGLGLYQALGGGKG